MSAKVAKNKGGQKGEKFNQVGKNAKRNTKDGWAHSRESCHVHECVSPLIKTNGWKEYCVNFDSVIPQTGFIISLKDSLDKMFIGLIQSAVVA